MAMGTIDKIRSFFPALSQDIYGKELVYLDNAATSQKPQSVIDLVNTMNSATNANVHRAMYYLSDKATTLYENARECVKEFINAPDRESVIFTSGATASLNLVAYSFCREFIKEGDVIIVSEDSHHSNIVPWQINLEQRGGQLRVLPIDDNGNWRVEELAKLIDAKVKLIAVPHISNIIGLVNPIEQLIKIAHDNGIFVLIDGAQGVVHEKIDVQSLDCDFYLFSGHKIYAETGSGVLYGKRELLDKMPPFMGGGDMVDRVSFAKTTYAPLPLKFEAGTPNFIAQASLKPALEFVKSYIFGEGIKEVQSHEREIVNYMLEEMKGIDGLKLYGVGENKIPLFSFSIDGCHPMDMAQLLDKMGIAVRSGQMCAEPIMSRYGVTAMVRASFLPYNTLNEAEYFIKSLKRVVKLLQ